MNLDIENPIFIIGGSRTGSEMIKTVLSMSQDLDLLNELFLYCPRWLHKDLHTNIKDHIGELDPKTDPRKVIDLLFSGIPYGWMFRHTEVTLDRAILDEELRKEPLSIRTIFLALMKMHTRKKGKRRIGAKFPLHYSYTHKLFEWFPNCTVIHTVRDPRAVYASQAEKHANTSQSWWRRQTSRFLQFVHICIQTHWTARTHRKFNGDSRYLLVRYEDVIRSPEESVRRLCKFTNIGFSPRMLRPGQYQSSFLARSRGSGFDTAPLKIWQNNISFFSQRLITIIVARPARDFGYDLKLLDT